MYRLYREEKVVDDELKEAIDGFEEECFHDGSKLYVKDYHFGPDERKYSFHWNDLNGKLKIRRLQKKAAKPVIR